VKVVVDTSVWSLALMRRKRAVLAPFELRVTQLLDRIIDEGRIQLLGPVRQELLSGLREEAQFLRLRDFLRDFPDCALTAADHEQAAQASNRCRKAGIASTSVDMLICAVALHRGWEIFSTDRDFVQYRRVLPLQMLQDGT
jgi:predicted nucleic acid-binding protein